MDLVSKKLSEVLGVTDDVNKTPEGQQLKQNPLTNQPIYSSSLITDEDIASFNAIENDLGLEDFSKIVLMKTAQKAMNDHDELIGIMAKVDDSKAARMAEVAQAALGNAADAAKSLMNFTLQQEKLKIEKQKLEIKSVTINNIGADPDGMHGTQKEIMDKIKDMMGDDTPLDDVPPLIDA